MQALVVGEHLTADHLAARVQEQHPDPTAPGVLPVRSRCGSVTEHSDDVIAPLAERVSRENGFTLEPRHFALLGTCRPCAEGAAGSDVAHHRD